MMYLTEQQRQQFDRDGFLVVDAAIEIAEILRLRRQFEIWVAESCAHTADYGETLDGRARFDLQPGHTASKPALRRVQSPEEVSSDFARVMRASKLADYCAELFETGVRFHHGKVNSKLPSSGTAVKWHQDFPFQPMSNDDMITCLLFLDDASDENGPLEVVPGSHTGPFYSLWHDGVFTGAVNDAVAQRFQREAVSCTGLAGSACLMHARLLHGLLANRSAAPRTLYIATYYAEDAIELSPNPLPSRFAHEIVRGSASGRIRCTEFSVPIPAVPKATSFFAQQEGLDVVNTKTD